MVEGSAEHELQRALLHNVDDDAGGLVPLNVLAVYEVGGLGDQSAVGLLFPAIPVWVLGEDDLLILLEGLELVGTIAHGVAHVGAVVGGLSGASKQNKEIKNMDIKILLRSTTRTSCVLHFKDINRDLKTKDETDRNLYETYVKRANQAKDILSIIIDNAKQTVAPIAQPVIAPSSRSVADELTKLAKLKADGILTEEEFQAQKTKLLGL